ncbi:MAG TPA: hypothetical protein VFZ73_02435 [Gemmatimonadaceae bacterium]
MSVLMLAAAAVDLLVETVLRVRRRSSGKATFIAPALCTAPPSAFTPPPRTAPSS